VLLEKLVVHFDSNRATVSWVGSLLCGVYLMSGPIVGGTVCMKTQKIQNLTQNKILGWVGVMKNSKQIKHISIFLNILKHFSGLVNKFGCRPVCILGSIVACAGLSLSTLRLRPFGFFLAFGRTGVYDRTTDSLSFC
jgi:hypothetical protein